MMQPQSGSLGDMVGHDGTVAVAMLLLEAHEAARPRLYQFHRPTEVPLRYLGRHVIAENTPELIMLPGARGLTTQLRVTETFQVHVRDAVFVEHGRQRRLGKSPLARQRHI